MYIMFRISCIFTEIYPLMPLFAFCTPLLTFISAFIFLLLPFLFSLHFPSFSIFPQMQLDDFHLPPEKRVKFLMYNFGKRTSRFAIQARGV